MIAELVKEVAESKVSRLHMYVIRARTDMFEECYKRLPNQIQRVRGRL